MTQSEFRAPEPRYVTMADLAAFEGRIINRIVELEARMERRFNEQTRWIIGLILPIYAVLLAMLLSTIFFLLPHVSFAS